MPLNSLKFKLESDGSKSARGDYLSQTRNEFEPFLAGHFTSIEVNRIILAIEEAIVNIFLHGYKDSEEQGSVSIEASIKNDHSLRVVIDDFAPIYDPTSVELSDPETRIESGETGGYGIFLLRTIMNVEHEINESGGNRLILTRKVTTSQ